MTADMYLQQRNNYVDTCLKSAETRENVMTSYGIIGDLSDMSFDDITDEDMHFIKGVLNHLGGVERGCARDSELVLRTYIDAVFDIFYDLTFQAKCETLNYSTWLTQFALNRGILVKLGNKQYAWADFNFEKRVYLDLFTLYFFGWYERYTKEPIKV